MSLLNYKMMRSDREVYITRSTAGDATVLGSWACAGNCRDGDRPDPGGPAPGSGTLNPQPPQHHYEQNDYGVAQRVLRVLSGSVQPQKPGPALLLGPMSLASLEGPTSAPISQALRCVRRAPAGQLQVLLTQMPLRSPSTTDQALPRVRATHQRQATRGPILLATLQSQTLGPATLLLPGSSPGCQTENSAVGTLRNRAGSVRKRNRGRSHAALAQRAFSSEKPNPFHLFRA